jgi:hypothetical protein
VNGSEYRSRGSGNAAIARETFLLVTSAIGASTLAYFVMAEALTNVAKHSHAHHAAVVARVEDGTLQVRVRDDGVGGARTDGSGLLGLSDRLAASRAGSESRAPQAEERSCPRRFPSRTSPWQDTRRRSTLPIRVRFRPICRASRRPSAARHPGL